MAAETQEAGIVPQGVDVEGLKAFLEFAAENPEDVQFELGARGVYEGRAIHTTATTGPYTLGGKEINRLAREYTTISGDTRRSNQLSGSSTRPTGPRSSRPR